MTRQKHFSLIALSLLLFAAQPALAGTFSTGFVTSPSDLQHGSGALWQAENSGGAAVTTNGGLYASGTPTSAFGAGASSLYITGSPSYSDPGLQGLLSTYIFNGGTLTATLSVTNGTSYNLELLFQDPLGPRPITVTAGTDSAAFSTLNNSFQAVKEDYLFTATGGTLVVSVASGFGPFINGFSLLTVPEPGTFVLFGLGAIGLFGVARRRRNWFASSLFACLSVLATSQRSDATPIPLASATATFSQAGQPAAQAIDGITTGNGGWAIHPNEGSSATIDFQTASAVPSSGELVFSLYHSFISGSFAENLGHFRLSATTNGGGTWNVLAPTSITDVAGSTFNVLGDNSILVSGINPLGNEIYTVVAPTTLVGINGFRLEALTDASLPVNGPGRSSDGNFVLTEFQAIIVPEPSSLALGALGVIGLFVAARRRRVS